ncbi:MAG: hypothetical protein ACPHY6_06830, partial [Candidatus Puniceispirillaceae bacterium]
MNNGKKGTEQNNLIQLFRLPGETNFKDFGTMVEGEEVVLVDGEGHCLVDGEGSALSASGSKKYHSGNTYFDAEQKHPTCCFVSIDFCFTKLDADL